MFRSSRDRRIDRALSSVLDAIGDEHDNKLHHCRTWREISILGVQMDAKRIDAHERAKKLRARWRRMVAECE